ncbi:hypothetical protein ACI79C_18355 [Geodermatophilus sp. SYSU D00697]
MADDRSAALVVRAWREEGVDGFRARVVAVGLGASEQDRTIAVASSPGEVLDAVGHWLDEFVGDQTDTD